MPDIYFLGVRRILPVACNMFLAEILAKTAYSLSVNLVFFLRSMPHNLFVFSYIDNMPKVS